MERSQVAHSRGNLGSLQLEVRLRDEMVLPSSCYQPLVQLLCHEVKLGMQVRGLRAGWKGPAVVGLCSCPPKPILQSRKLRSGDVRSWPVPRAPSPATPWENVLFPWGALRSSEERVWDPPCLSLQGPGQLISLIEETTSTECRQDVATNLLKLFLGQGLAKDFLDLLFQLELSRTSEA